jgi:hypothetical protein
MSIPRDIREFLDGYPEHLDDRKLNANLRFYRNERRCRPDNLLIDEIHEQCVRHLLDVGLKQSAYAEFPFRWKGDYETLEWNHGFIQWL